MPLSAYAAELNTTTATIQTAPGLICVCDFPPCDMNGGTILLLRQLSEYPPEKLTIIAGTAHLKKTPLGERLRCRYVGFPETGGTGRWGLGRLKQLLDWLLLPFLCCVCFREMRRSGRKGVLSVAHGRFFLAAAWAASLAKVPLILIVHDDWEQMMARSIPRVVARRLLQAALRRADQVLAVSEGMQELIHQRYGVESDLQLPATEPISCSSATSVSSCLAPVQIAYAGSFVDVVEVLISVVQRESQKYHLHIYSVLDMDHVRQRGWDCAGVTFHGWMKPADVRAALREADLLFLPQSFADCNAQFVATSFPAKTADYLAAGKPIIACGPEYSSVIRYAGVYPFAEVVTRPTFDGIRSAIERVIDSPQRGAELVAVGRELFARNHDIRVQRREFQRRLSELCERGLLRAES
jgi:glycosyltransferase involved in cell wall biosynthesis